MIAIERDLRRFPLTRSEQETMNAQLQEENTLKDLKAQAASAIRLAREPLAYGTIASLSIQASENVPGFSPVTLSGHRANSSGGGKVVGLSASDTQQGFNINVISMGTVTNPQWNWTPSAPIYLNDNGLSQAPPSTGFVQQVGIAKTSDTIFVYPQQSILL